MTATFRTALLVTSAFAVSGCASWLHNAEGGAFEINKIKDAIECELAAVARHPDPTIRPADIDSWGVKSDLELTLLATGSADGGLTYVLRTVDPLRLIPSAAISGRDYTNAQIEFASSFATAKKKHPGCATGPDPSGTGMGLAAWFESTLRAIPRRDYGGMTFTTEFELAASAGSRFGYTFTRVFGDAGISGKLSHTHRLTVAISLPPVPTLPKAIPVYIVSAPETKAATPLSSAKGVAGPGPALRAVPLRVPQSVSPALRDPTLDRLLDNRRRIRTEDR